MAEQFLNRPEIAAAREKGFTAQELDETRKGLLSARRLSRAQDDVVASVLAINLELGRSFAVSQKIDEALEKLTLEEVNAAFRKWADPSRWSIAWGGDFKGAQ